MAMNRDQFRQKLRQIMNLANQLDIELEQQSKKPEEEGLGVCPIHGKPWIKYKFGLAHPPVEEGGKWCHKRDVDKLM